MNNKNIVKFGSLPYGTVFKFNGEQYKKNVYPGITISDNGYGSALNKNEEILMFSNTELVQIVYAPIE